MSYEHSPFHPADLLLPRADIQPETWACVACDQYTSQPEYWREVENLVGDAPPPFGSCCRSVT